MYVYLYLYVFVNSNLTADRFGFGFDETRNIEYATHQKYILQTFVHRKEKKMKAIVCLFGLFAIAAAYPTQEGAAYTNEAIRQAQTSHLIPQNAQIQNVSEKQNRDNRSKRHGRT